MTGFTQAAIKDYARAAIGPHSTVVSDGLSCFRGFDQLNDCHKAIMAGGCRTIVAKPASNWVNMLLDNIKNAITGTLHAVSSRHVPRYLAGYEYRFNSRFKLAAMIERFARVALITQPMPRRFLTMAEACK